MPEILIVADAIFLGTACSTSCLPGEIDLVCVLSSSICLIRFLMAHALVFAALALTGLLPVRASSTTYQNNCSSASGLESLRLSEQARVIFPGDIAFDNATLRWTSFQPPSYSVVVTPSCESDIQKLASLARLFLCHVRGATLLT